MIQGRSMGSRLPQLDLYLTYKNLFCNKYKYITSISPGWQLSFLLSEVHLLLAFYQSHKSGFLCTWSMKRFTWLPGCFVWMMGPCVASSDLQYFSKNHDGLKILKRRKMPIFHILNLITISSVLNLLFDSPLATWPEVDEHIIKELAVEGLHSAPDTIMIKL